MPQRPHCHPGPHTGGSQRAFHPAGPDLTPFISYFPQLKIGSKLLLSGGGGGREEAAPPQTTRYPPPGPLQVRAYSRGGGGWTTSAGTCLLWAKSCLEEAARAGHTPRTAAPPKPGGRGRVPAWVLSSGQDSGAPLPAAGQSGIRGLRWGLQPGPTAYSCVPFSWPSSPWHRVLTRLAGCGNGDMGDSATLLSIHSLAPREVHKQASRPAQALLWLSVTRSPLKPAGSCQMGCGAKYRAHVLHTHPHFAQVPSALWHQPDMARYLWQGSPCLRGAQAQGGNLRVTCLLQLTGPVSPGERCFRGEAGAKEVSWAAFYLDPKSPDISTPRGPLT